MLWARLKMTFLICKPLCRREYCQIKSMIRYVEMSICRNINMRGTALIYVLLTIGIILSIMLFLTSVFGLKLKSAFDYPNSVTALYAADSGAEWQLYNRLKDPDAASPSLTNGATFTVVTPPGSFPVKVIGKFRGVSRSIEISL